MVATLRRVRHVAFDLPASSACGASYYAFSGLKLKCVDLGMSVVQFKKLPASGLTVGCFGVFDGKHAAAYVARPLRCSCLPAIHLAADVW